MSRLAARVAALEARATPAPAARLEDARRRLALALLTCDELRRLEELIDLYEAGGG